MATLTVTAYYARNVIKYGSIFIVFLIFARVVWMAGVGIYTKLFPPPPPPPQVAFGKLPMLFFPDRPPGLSYSYILQTTTGSLPSLPPQGLIYFMPQATSSLKALDEATSIAHELGFSGKITSQSETIYRFERERSAQSMDINIVNKTFSVNFDLTQTPELLQTRPGSTAAVSQITNSFLSTTELFTPDLKAGSQTFEYLKVQDGALVSTISLSDAQFVRINYFRSNYPLTTEQKSDVPVLTPNRKDGNVWFIVSGDSAQGKAIIGGEYHYFPIDTSRKSTYPLKTAQQAWDDLTQGRAFIATQTQDNSQQVTIRKIYMSYYDSGRPEGFLQPIIVFEGDNGFMAYDPAVTNDYYSAPTPSPTPVPATDSGQTAPTQ